MFNVIKFTKIVLFASLFIATACSECKDGDKNCKKKTDSITNSTGHLDKHAGFSSIEKYASVQNLSSGSHFVPDRVFFAYDDYSVELPYSDDLEGQAKYIVERIAKNADLKVVIEGNCDQRGSVEYNYALGLKRANAVKEKLIAYGVHAKSISVTSFGKERILVKGSDNVSYLQNRAGVTRIIVK